MSKFISKEGRKHLKRVARWLEAGAPHVDGAKVDGFDMSTGVHNHPQCGTVCCIAGAVVQFAKPTEVSVGDGLPWSYVRNEARTLLGITNDDAIRLFTPHGFEDNPFTPAQAASVIRKYLATGEIDWSVL